MTLFKPDGNIYDLASCECAKKLHMKDEFQSYVLLFLRGLRQGSYLSVSQPLYAFIPFNGNYVQHFYILYLRFVLRKGGDVRQKKILPRMSQFCDEIF